MAGTRTRDGRRFGSQDDRPTTAERVLRGVGLTAAVLAFMVGVFVLPIQFIDSRLSAMVEAIDSAGIAPYPALGIEQRVEEDRYGYGVEELVATYRDDDGEVVTAQLHRFGQLRVVREEEGWQVMPDGPGREIYVTPDGRDGFLAEDYRDMLRNEDEVIYLAGDAWVAGWAAIGLVALGARSVLRLRRGVVGAGGAALAPALYCLGAVALVALGWAVSFPLGAGF
ncbi:hypothetical protein [Blastococcus sp. TF02A-35]|uniref:hypothetical protein n=1 Tax=Blastococcus sp. TF02A-35 TaxID=2559612 RepID=UPI001073BC77|nr:hypothetical protein [Blastococcus sp. TF02A_35]TFV43958.1 hypothetical protein E4P43_19360 [Blastococcus sp. TF02A_35]